MDRMHRAARIGYRTDLIGVKLLPPIKRRQNIAIDHEHTHELTMVRTGITEPHHEILIVRTNVGSPLTIVINRNGFLVVRRPKNTKLTITLIPRIKRITHSSNSVLPANDFGVRDRNHAAPPQLAYRRYHSEP